MKKKLAIYAILLIVVVLGVNRYFPVNATPAVTISDIKNEATTTHTVEEYVRLHISDLSREKAVLGGTLFVTKIEAINGSGVVEYEDGHNAFTADFTYTNTDGNAPTITTFVVRPL